MAAKEPVHSKLQFNIRMESSKRLSADVPHCTGIPNSGFCQTGTSGQNSE